MKTLLVIVKGTLKLGGPGRWFPESALKCIFNYIKSRFENKLPRNFRISFKIPYVFYIRLCLFWFVHMVCRLVSSHGLLTNHLKQPLNKPT